MANYLGIDIGGTFTDLVLLADGRPVLTAKTATTPGELQAGVLNGLDELARAAGIDLTGLLRSLDRFAHGTTVTINALLEGKGARTGLITTRGFESHLVLMNGERGTGLPGTEAMHYSKVRRPAPGIVPLRYTRGITERVDRTGQVLVPMDDAEVQAAVAELRDQGVQSFAVSLLWSLRNPAHEERIAALIRAAFPEAFVSISSQVAPAVGEYERTATTAVNAALGPILRQYVAELHQALAARGLSTPMLLVQSRGGLIPAQEAPERAVATMMSGLAAGVRGAQYVAEHLGEPNLITTDVGGTSFEVGIVYQGHPAVNLAPLSPRIAPYETRYRLRTPMVDITPIGAGGGSIAWIDDAGLLHVGPESAGARPGPACYPGGGDRATLTDASILLGLLNPHNFLGGRIRLDADRAARAVDSLARRLGMDTLTCARGIVRVAAAQMADLVRKVTIGQGHDPREFVLFAYGGAGPTYCAYYGGEIGIERIIIPGQSLASAMTALGSALAPLQTARTASVPLRSPFDRAALARAAAALTRDARTELAAWGAPPAAIATEALAHVRYVGQSYDLQVSLGSGAGDAISDISERFYTKYQSLYGEAAVSRATPLEITAVTVTAQVPPPRPPLAAAARRRSGRLAPQARRTVHFLEGSRPETPIFAGPDLAPADRVVGPAVIEFPTTTVVVPPAYGLTVDRLLNLVLTRRADDGQRN